VEVELGVMSFESTGVSCGWAMILSASERGVWMRVAGLLCACFWGIGCTSGENPQVEAFDSAGVRITVNHLPSAPQTRALGEPVLSIGSVVGDEAYLFDGVSGGLILDGRIIVADVGGHAIRFFDSGGIHQKTVGGAGEGPGEFRDLGSLGRYRGDSIIVWDRTLQRVTVFDKSGEVGRANRLASNPTGAGIRYIAQTADGTLFGRGTIPISGSPPLWRTWRDTLAVIRYRPDGSQPQLIAELPGDDRFALSTSGGALQINNHPLGRIPALSAVGNELLYADGTTTSVDVLSPGGELSRRFRLTTEPREATDDVITTLKSRFIGEDPEPAWVQEVERLFSSIQWPESVPGSAALLSDPSGDTWLEVFGLDYGVGRDWIRFGASGAYRYTLETPPGFVPLDFGNEFVLGLERDDLGVERITLRPIHFHEE